MVWMFDVFSSDLGAIKLSHIDLLIKYLVAGISDTRLCCLIFYRRTLIKLVKTSLLLVGFESGTY